MGNTNSQNIWDQKPSDDDPTILPCPHNIDPKVPDYIPNPSQESIYFDNNQNN